jgi:predicted unusual protein kinase regulating ubiquinone biosynthesis (AarF/ABC1/UbiB family)
VAQNSIPKGRLKRLGKVIGLTARVGTGLMAGRAKRMLGGEGDPKVDAARRVLETLGELKGAALKLGQMLSLASDRLPPEVRDVVSRLFSQAPTLPFEQIAAVIAQELGAPPAEVFATFEAVPFAGASLGQVHRARLRSGEEVAVKVQYPGVAEALESDLQNAQSLVRALGLGGSLLDRREYVEELRREVLHELDYRRELAHAESFRGFFARWPDLVVPRAYPSFCTAKVLVFERLEGPTLHAYAQGAAQLSREERFEVGERLVRAVFGPFLFHRVIHGDAHPGNFVILDGGRRLGVLDYGSAKHLSERFWGCYVEAFAEALCGRHPDVFALLRQGGFTFAMPDERARAFVNEVSHIVGGPLRGPYDFSQDAMLQDLLALKRRNLMDLLRVRPPVEALLFYRAIAGLGHNLRTLRAAGDFRPFFAKSLEELGRLQPPAPGPAPGPSSAPGDPGG